MLTIVIPMAGRGQRFKAAGYEAPKPMIDVAGMPMVERVRRNLPPADQLIVVALNEHYDQVKPWLTEVNRLGAYQHIHAAYLEEVTAGAACTVYGVIDEVHPESELLVANSDQWLDWSPEHFIDYCRRSKADGVIPCFRATDPKWSFLTLKEDGSVRYVVEKRAVSDISTCGIYYWRQAKDCFTSIEEMVRQKIMTNGEVYLAPSYNHMIYNGSVILPYPTPVMWPMGTPDDLKKTLSAGVLPSQLL